MRAAEDTLLFVEAAEAPAVAARQAAELSAAFVSLGERLRETQPPLVMTCARGSSDHAATYAKYLIETRVRIPVASYAPSVSSVYETRWQGFEGALFLALSQSGQSPDVVLSARAARDAGALVVAMVNVEDSPLAEVAEIMLPLLAGPERSVAASKSFIASLLAIARLVGAWTGDEALLRALNKAPDALERAGGLDWSPALSVLGEASNLFVLGRGLTLGIAQEAALKLKETCALHAEAFSAAELRHGPVALIGPDFPAVMFVPGDEAGEAFEPLAQELRDRGATTLVAADPGFGPTELPVVRGLHPVLAPIAAIQSFYRLAARLAVARGLDPDNPPHLRKVTRTK